MRMTKKQKILIVDDEPELVEELSLILTEEGYAVTAAPDGLQAVELFREGSYDLVLMDVKMPEMNGVDALHEILAINPEAKVVIITGSFAQNLSAQALEDGAVAALFKPFDPEVLLETIKKLVQEP
jgi:CheY-like chemotaxis protein